MARGAGGRGKEGGGAAKWGGRQVGRKEGAPSGWRRGGVEGVEGIDEGVICFDRSI